MERTPSPPRRLHTPPAPLHGDSYEPYSPRRSTRVAAQRSFHSHHEQTSPRARRDITPTASSRQKQTSRISNFTLSPPSSPVSSPQHRSSRTTRRAHFEADPIDAEHVAPTPARRFLSTMTSGMLPTPTETPRKRPLQTEASLKSTARVLFPARPATIDEVVPTPRKMRKTKHLFSLDAADNMEEGSGKIQIFTDSKERIPTHDDEEDNPFVIKKGKAKATRQQPKRASVRAEMDDAVDRDEGMIYLFRGRRVYRKFHEGPPSNGSPLVSDSGEDLGLEDKATRRQVGSEARRPLTRSSIKPRLLFQEEIKERKRMNGEETDDEEADTEIEAPPTPSKKKGKAVNPQPQVTLELTPPPTVRKPKREMSSSFDSWTRVKCAHSSGGSARDSKKRKAEPLEREADKRARSEQSVSSMSLDNF
ncbi:hypothetical protein GQ44DRAFT_716720 [Phaeosphaeriaceae sp. PMI808]|nr:hypothetical protein GQ44DRAFT_716720 [Phaeosphaeriaceae sp. PMI808]